MTAGAAGDRGFFERSFGALRHRYYRWIWLGAFVSTAGTWLHWSAVGFIVADETGSAFLVSLLGFVNFIPSLFFGLVGGAIADRFDRRRVLLLTQWIELVLVAALAVLFFLGYGTLLAIYLITFLLGLSLAFNGPVFFSFYPTLVPPEDLPSAISMNSVQFNVGRVIGPTVGGFVLQVAGAAVALALNAFSFLAMIIALSAMRRPREERSTHGESGVASIRSGFRYVRRHHWVGTVLTAKVAQAAFAAQIITLLPQYATGDLGLDAAGNGFLFGALGLGGLVGALLSPIAIRALPRERFVPLAMLGIGGVLAVTAFADSFGVAMLALFIAGVFYIGGGQVGFNSIIQMGISDEYRGRVSSMVFTIFVGIFPIAGLIWGVVATLTSVAFTYLAGAILCALYAAVVFSRPTWLREESVSSARDGQT